MTYQQIFPEDALKPYIKYFWTLEHNAAGCKPKTFKIIADGCPGLIFQEHSGSFFSAENKELPQLFLYGQTTKYDENVSKGNFKTLGVNFRPGTLNLIFDVSTQALTNELADLNLIHNQTAVHSLTEQLTSTCATERKIAILSSFLLARISSNTRRETGSVRYTLQKIHQHHGRTDLNAVMAGISVSKRTLERSFNQEVGMSAKLYARIVRFQHSLQGLRKGNYGRLSDIAFEHNYADQSHFIRDFKEFTGSNPGRFLKHTHEIAENFPEWRS
jgi:AraC-like DNA-binding protein